MQEDKTQLVLSIYRTLPTDLEGLPQKDRSFFFYFSFQGQPSQKLGCFCVLRI